MQILPNRLCRSSPKEQATLFSTFVFFGQSVRMGRRKSPSLLSRMRMGGGINGHAHLDGVLGSLFFLPHIPRSWAIIKRASPGTAPKEREKRPNRPCNGRPRGIPNGGSIQKCAIPPPFFDRTHSYSSHHMVAAMGGGGFQVKTTPEEEEKPLIYIKWAFGMAARPFLSPLLAHSRSCPTLKWGLKKKGFWVSRFLTNQPIVISWAKCDLSAAKERRRMHFMGRQEDFARGFLGVAP